IPVFEGELDKIIGILYNKDVFKALQEKSDFRLRDHLHPAFFVPSTLPISELLKQLQRRRLAMALVVNEFGEVEGLATLEDLVEENGYKMTIVDMEGRRIVKIKLERLPAT